MARNSLTDLLAQKAALDRKIADMQRVHRADAIAKVKAMMSEYGLTAADIGNVNAGDANGSGGSRGNGAGRPAPAGRTAGQGSAVAGKRAKPSANAGRKVAPKYRNPATGDTWSGRGLKPKWLTAALNSGRSLSEFAL